MVLIPGSCAALDLLSCGLLTSGTPPPPLGERAGQGSEGCV